MVDVLEPRGLLDLREEAARDRIDAAIRIVESMRAGIVAQVGNTGQNMGRDKTWKELVDERYIVAGSHEAPRPLVDAAEAANTAVFKSPVPSVELMWMLRPYLARALAESTIAHGVFLDVLGMGVLITGDSGVGKSELALELISRGSGLIADDVMQRAQAQGWGQRQTLAGPFLSVPYERSWTETVQETVEGKSRERRTERSSDFERDGNGTPAESDHDEMRHPAVVLEVPGQLMSGTAAIRVDDHGKPPHLFMRPPKRRGRVRHHAQS